MYKFGDGQINFSDFGQPHGMKMNAENRRVKKTESIPWQEIEERYAKLFTNKKGNVAKPLRLALGACIIQAEYGFSDVETALMIQEHPYLQFFCGFTQYKDEPPFDPSLMVYFRKRLSMQILGEINEIIIAHNSPKKKQSKRMNDQDGDDGGGNNGTLIVDATCAPSKIRYPQDTSLLNEAREKTEVLIDVLHTPGEKKPRTYRQKARKEYINFTKNRKKGIKNIRKQIKCQLGYLSRNLKHIEQMQAQVDTLTLRQKHQLEIIGKVYEQQKYMYDNKVHSVADRIVSISQPWLRPIVRGKAGTPVEFGAKPDISVADGWTRLEVLSFEAYNEAGNLQRIVERFKERTGFYPKRVLADKIFRNRDNLAYCRKHHIRLSGPALGRPKKYDEKERKQIYDDAIERIEVERRFSLAKRKCGLGMITTRLPESIASVIGMSIVVLNLRKIQCIFFRKLFFCFSNLLENLQNKNLVFIQ
ncbi:MAG: IS5 family transposase [Leptospirales bacterium]|nr:IS5 family transposase [Leptospirales bacterium]